MANEVDDIINAIIGEALGEGQNGQIAVAYVIANRAEINGQSPTDVVRAPGQFHGYSKPGAAARAAQQDPQVREQVGQIWEAVQAKRVADPTGGADFFRTDAVSPKWSREFPTTATVNNHIFHKSPQATAYFSGTPQTSAAQATAQVAQAAPTLQQRTIIGAGRGGAYQQPDLYGGATPQAAQASREAGYPPDLMPNIQDVSSAYAKTGIGRGPMDSVNGLIIHHTGGRGNVDGIVRVFEERRVGSQYVMERDGTIYRVMADGTKANHMKPGQGPGAGMTNANVEGIEVIAKDDSDWTAEQKAAMAKFGTWHAAKNGYDPAKGIMGHGEVNSHKRADEGMVGKTAVLKFAPTAAQAVEQFRLTAAITPPGELGTDVGTQLDTAPMAYAPAPATASIGLTARRNGQEPINEVGNMPAQADMTALARNPTPSFAGQDRSESTPIRYQSKLPAPQVGMTKDNVPGLMPTSQQIVEFARAKPVQSYAGQDGAGPQVLAAPAADPNARVARGAPRPAVETPAPVLERVARGATPAAPIASAVPGQSIIERTAATSSVDTTRSIAQMEQTQRQPAPGQSQIERSPAAFAAPRTVTRAKPGQSTIERTPAPRDPVNRVRSIAEMETTQRAPAPGQSQIERAPESRARQVPGQSQIERTPTSSANDVRSIAQMEASQRQPAPGQSQIERTPAPARVFPGQSQIERTPTTSVNKTRSVADMETTQRKPAPGQSVIERSPTPVVAAKPTPAPAPGLTPSQAQPRAPAPVAAKAASAADIPKYITTSKRVPATPTAANGKVPLGEMTYSTSRDNKNKAAEGEAAAKKIEWKTVTTSKLNPEWVAQNKPAVEPVKPAKPAVTAKPAAPKKEERTPGNLVQRVRTAVGMPEDGLGGQILGNVRETFGMPRDGIGGGLVGNLREKVGMPRDGFGISPVNLAGGVIRGVQRAAGLEQGPNLPVGTVIGKASNGGDAIQGHNGVRNSTTQESHAWQVSTGQKARGNTASNDTQYENW